MKGQAASPPPRRGKIYLTRLDPTEGSEQAGTRPVVVVSRDAINRYSPVIVVCPLTDAVRVPKLYPSDVLVKAPGGGLAKDSVILTAQVGLSPGVAWLSGWESSSLGRWPKWSRP